MMLAVSLNWSRIIARTKVQFELIATYESFYSTEIFYVYVFIFLAELQIVLTSTPFLGFRAIFSVFWLLFHILFLRF